MRQKHNVFKGNQKVALNIFLTQNIWCFHLNVLHLHIELGKWIINNKMIYINGRTD